MAFFFSGYLQYFNLMVSYKGNPDLNKLPLTNPGFLKIFQEVFL